jgi:glyoxylase-like metal-dependent hydrolase (beta-lactamase superfamily II)
MEPTFARFPIGAFDCASLLDGSMDYPIQSMYANVSRQEVEAAFRQRNLPVEIITTPYSYLYVHAENRHILVDVGAGDLGPNTGNLLLSLREMGVAPEDIDVVIISHAHPDHIGGNLDADGKPLYPNARYFIWKEEWDFWNSPAALAACVLTMR